MTTLDLSSLLSQNSKEATGSSIDNFGGVDIQPQPSQSVEIKDSTGANAIVIDPDGDIVIGDSSIAINRVVNSINASDINNPNTLATTQSIVDFVGTLLSTTLEFTEFNNKADYDAFAASPPFSPTIAFVFDAVPFTFTDSKSQTVTDVTYMFVVTAFDGTGVITTIVASSESSELTGSQIITILSTEPDANLVSDANLAAINNLPPDTSTELDGKVNAVVGKVLSDNNYTNADRAAVNSLTSTASTPLNTLMPIESTDINMLITNSGSGNGRLDISNAAAVENNRTYRIGARSSGRIDITAITDSGSEANRWDFIHGSGNFVSSGNILKNGNDPVVGESVITSNIDAAAGFIPDAPTVKAAIGAVAVQEFNGGTVGGQTIFQSDNKDALVLKVNNNAGGNIGIALQNSGNNYTTNLYRDSASSASGPDIVWTMGNDPDINNLPNYIRFANSGPITIEPNVHVNGDVFCFDGGNMAASDITAVGELGGATGNITGNLAVGGLITSASINNTNNIICQGDITATNIGAVSNVSSNNFSSTGTFSGNSMSLTGTVSFSNIVTVQETGEMRIRDERNENVSLRKLSGSTGVELRALTNPLDGEPIFTVNSSGGGMRLRVEHNGVVSTTNSGMKVDTDNNGVGGHEVIHEGNWRRITATAVYYFQDFPSLTAQDVASWDGKNVYFFGTGSGTITLPDIAAIPTNTQMREGASFNLFNYNSGSDITLAKPASHKFMVDDVGDIRTTNQTLFFSSAINILGADLTAYSAVQAKSYVYRGI